MPTPDFLVSSPATNSFRSSHGMPVIIPAPSPLHTRSTLSQCLRPARALLALCMRPSPCALPAPCSGGVPRATRQGGQPSREGTRQMLPRRGGGPGGGAAAALAAQKRRQVRTAPVTVTAAGTAMLHASEGNRRLHAPGRCISAGGGRDVTHAATTGTEHGNHETAAQETRRCRGARDENHLALHVCRHRCTPRPPALCCACNTGDAVTLCTMSWLRSPLRLATNPTPHASRSSSPRNGSYLTALPLSLTILRPAACRVAARPAARETERPASRLDQAARGPFRRAGVLTAAGAKAEASAGSASRTSTCSRILLELSLRSAAACLLGVCGLPDLYK